MRTLILIMAVLSLTLTGCGNRFDPLSPRNKNAIRDLNGKLEEQKTNQNGIMMDLMKLRQEQSVQAGRDAENQQGVVNLNGDGAVIAIIVVTALIMGGSIAIAYYRSQAVKNQQAAQILAQQVAMYDDVGLDNQIFAAAMNSPAEGTIYHLMVRGQKLTGKTYAR